MRQRLSVLLLVLVALFLGSTGAAQADTATPLPFLEGSTSLAVDPVGQHVFVSDGAGSSSIIVLDYDGNIVKTITGQNGASEMAVDTATHTLYVALHDATAISEIDTQTLTETKRFSTAPYSDPTRLVIANGRLWFSSTGTGNCCVVSADLDGTGMATASLQDGVANPGEYTSLAAGGTGGKLLAVGQLYSTGQTAAAVYDISQDPPALVSSTSDADGCYYGEDLTMDPTGANLFLACTFPHSLIGLSTTDLSSSTEYPIGSVPWPYAVAASADGNYLAGGVSGCGNDQPGDDVFVFPIGNTTPLRTWSIGLCSVAPDSLAFSPDASRLFVVAGAGVGAGDDFYTLDQPTVPMTETVTSLTPSQNSIYTGQQITLTGHVTGTATGTVHLYGTPEGGSKTLLATSSVGAGGDVVFSVTPAVSTVYTAALDAGQGYAASISPDIVVTVTPPSVSLSPSQHSIYAGQQVTLTANVTGASTGTVQLYGTPNGGSKTLVATGAVTAGEAVFTVSPTATTAYSAVLEAGDGHPSATSPDVVVTVITPISTTVTLSSSEQLLLAGDQASLTAQVTGTVTGTVDLYATPSGGSKTLVTTGGVGAAGAGRVSFTVSPTVTTTYSAVLEARTGYASSTSQDVTVTFVPRSMPIAASKHTVTYGDKVNLTLTGVKESGKVDLFAAPNGKTQTLLKTATVASGHHSVTFAVSPRRITSYVAEREDHAAASNNLTVSVRPLLKLAVAVKRVSPRVARRHGEKILIAAGRKPALPGEPMEIEIDRAGAHGGWTRIARGNVPVGVAGIVVLVGTLKKTGRYRARASYGGDDNFTSVRSGWRRFRVG
jgi:hypothetical protein